MKLHEYEAKKIFKKYGIDVPKSFLIKKGDDVELKEFDEAVLKAQVLVGGRGKAGGILFTNKENFKEKVEELFNKEIKGEKVDKILVEEKLRIKKEYYLSITIDRNEKKPVIIFSSEGGVDIEEIAEKHPEKIIKYYVDIKKPFLPYIGREIAKKAGVEIKVGDIIYKVYKIFKELDATLVEINPLVITEDNKIYAADAVIHLDDDSYFRQDFSEFEEYKNKENLPFAYVELDGDVAVIGNGAGLTLASMDTIYDFGLKPACFLDIGGGADEETTKLALKKVLENKKVKGIFINVLGGITRCDEVAKAIVEILKDNPNIKFSVRLTGTNEELGRKILEEANIPYSTSMYEAGKRLAESLRFSL
ncbi:succinyl-CoA synthetase, beta subunit [Methanocaldococcus infernus ME]|uniref:Succinate--CoA ligase [ADP-forming] subunit beta n=1 Tax=Methanocaldococcus infernus (strain DSM 11812 / JCM 15783 / ME) TaxID=573063 RepID=D5VR47_METIM|nr:ADP-forming succinate--CoA ligase subunit beta [Methanocaldococcus infernus]ADG13050.1 succinyl-CoA synthetase, beta subunit [Methanocaldococcus infernus ME]